MRRGEDGEEMGRPVEGVGRGDRGRFPSRNGVVRKGDEKGGGWRRDNFEMGQGPGEKQQRKNVDS